MRLILNWAILPHVMELKARKMNRTKFLDSLCEALIKKMDEQDEK